MLQSDFIIGVLTILVTVLIGYQVFNVVYQEQHLRRLVRATINEQLKELNNAAFSAVNMCFYEESVRSYLIYLRNCDWYAVVLTLKGVIDHVVMLKREDLAETLLKETEAIAQYMNAFDEKTLTEYHVCIERLKELLPLFPSLADRYVRIAASLGGGIRS